MRLAIVFVLTALGVAIYLADAKPMNVDTNVAINIQNPPRAKVKPMTQRAAARVKPDKKETKVKTLLKKAHLLQLTKVVLSFQHRPKVAGLLILSKITLFS